MCSNELYTCTCDKIYKIMAFLLKKIVKEGQQMILNKMDKYSLIRLRFAQFPTQVLQILPKLVPNMLLSLK